MEAMVPGSLPPSLHRPDPVRLYEVRWREDPHQPR